jgi:hypothetical protein
MPGPNSAPNGDAGLVRGHAQERFIFCNACHTRAVEKALEEELPVPRPKRYPARTHAAKHGRLRTGKTANK